jgi:hypothetical protein
MGPNLIILPIAALIPMIVGFIWYHPKVVGSAWMKETGMTQEKVQSGNMAVVLGVSYLLSIFLAFGLFGIVTHQMGVMSLFAMEPGFGEQGSEIMKLYNTIMDVAGGNHLTFGHGALHGVVTGIAIALPILGTNALFEQKTWKYIWINVGYWTVTCALMGGVLCKWGWNVG